MIDWCLTEIGYFYRRLYSIFNTYIMALTIDRVTSNKQCNIKMRTLNMNIT